MGRKSGRGRRPRTWFRSCNAESSWAEKRRAMQGQSSATHSRVLLTSAIAPHPHLHPHQRPHKHPASCTPHPHPHLGGFGG
eukprot:6633263-Lingulodinium_polyedra.AAC.1